VVTPLLLLQTPATAATLKMPRPLLLLLLLLLRRLLESQLQPRVGLGA
jgi:hypothetical protein